ncbi:hypothetical protein [Streptomyces sp. NBC_01190]|uniref:hypothetical protein n=1 Tax=Streptomyces sp. NBC_01190 TaxID=2903767 RepID=UPI0038658029|nr:hypothetical protein OG519_09320 [Streptomyces sp. NBC_01190]
MLIAYVDPHGGCAAGDGGCRDQSVHALWIMGGLLAAGLLIALVTVLVLDARRKRLLARGTAAQAVITVLDPRGPVRDAGRVKVAVTLTVTPPDGGASFETWTTERFPLTALPQVGWAVPVRYWPDDPHRVALAGPAGPVRPPVPEG